MFAVGLPLADSAVSTDRAAAAGSVTDIGLGVRITPVSNWSVVPQPRNRPQRAQFTRTGALLTIEGASYRAPRRTPYVRLAGVIDSQAGVQIATNPATVTTTSGLVGIAGAFASATEQGYLAVFTARGVLAVAIAESPLAAFHLVDDDLLSMIRSVAIGPPP